MAALALLLSVPVASSPALAGTDGPRVIAVQTTPASDVSMVIAAPAAQPEQELTAEDLSVTVDGEQVTATVIPLSSASLSVALVIDTAADVTADALEAAQTGATDFLLQLPDEAHTMVVAAGGDPRIVAPLGSEPAEAVSAVSALRTGGAQSTAAGTLLAAQELAAAPPGPRLIIVDTHGTDERAPSVEQLVRAASRAEAVIDVIQTDDDDSWSQVVGRAGGAVLRTDTAGVVQAYGRIAAALGEQYLVTFQAPGELPAVAEVTVNTGDVQSRTVVRLPAPDPRVDTGEQPGAEPAGREWRPMAVMASGLGLVVLALVGLKLHARRRGSSEKPLTRSVGPPASTAAEARSMTMPTEEDVRPASAPDGARPSSVATAPAISPQQPPVRRGALTAAVRGLRSARHDRESTLVSRIGLRIARARDERLAEEGRNAGIVLSGSGDGVVELTRKVSGPAAVRIAGNLGSRYFGVRALGTEDDLVITLRPYEGVRPLDWNGSESTGFAVSATGSWRIEVLPLSVVPKFRSSFNGEGDMVVRFTGNGSLAVITGNDAGRYFQVRALDSHGTEGLVNTTQEYSGSCQLSRAPRFFEVQAVGSWTIAVK